MKLLLTAAILLVLLASFGCSRPKPQQDAVEQTTFCDDSSPDRALKPVALPPVVLTRVMNTTEGREARALAKSKGADTDPAKILKGQRVQLSASGGPFFVVMGSHSITGSDHAWFWLVRHDHTNDSEKARIVLFAGGTCLGLDANKTHAYRDIIMTWSSPSETITNTYVFNGREYKIRKTSSHPNR